MMNVRLKTRISARIYTLVLLEIGTRTCGCAIDVANSVAGLHIDVGFAGRAHVWQVELMFGEFIDTWRENRELQAFVMLYYM
eukprot:1841845-Rhodomonas_salina.2